MLEKFLFMREVSAQSYIPLVPEKIPALQSIFSNNPFVSDNSIAGIVNQTVTILLIAAVVLAVIMIIFGGFQYMTSADSGARKDAAKKRIRSSVWGLLIAFSSILILTTINPGITNVNLNTQPVQPPQTLTGVERVDRQDFLDEFGEGFKTQDHAVTQFVRESIIRHIQNNPLAAKNLIEKTLQNEGPEMLRRVLLEILETERGALSGFSEEKRKLFEEGVAVLFEAAEGHGDSARQAFGARTALGLYDQTPETIILTDNITSGLGGMVVHNIGSFSDLFESNDIEALILIMNHYNGIELGEDNQYLRELRVFMNGEYESPQFDRAQQIIKQSLLGWGPDSGLTFNSESNTWEYTLDSPYN